MLSCGDDLELAGAEFGKGCMEVACTSTEAENGARRSQHFITIPSFLSVGHDKDLYGDSLSARITRISPASASWLQSKCVMVKDRRRRKQPASRLIKVAVSAYSPIHDRGHHVYRNDRDKS